MFVLQVNTQGDLIDPQSKQTVTLRGVNLDSACKLPSSPHVTTYTPLTEEFWDGDNVSFIGRPFPLNEASEHLERIKAWGFNTIRYVFTWESLEHKGPGVYDEEFITYTIEVLKLIKSYGFYCFLDPHQDIWGRFSGGSGAPMWTYYAVGIDPKNFKACEAALVQNTWKPTPEDFPKMIWATNYSRSVCQTMFSLFFAGKYYAPKAIINGQNIEEYLQGCMLKALLHFYERIQTETDLFETSIFAVETMNEPNMGMIGVEDITVVPKGQNLKFGTVPTAFQSMLLSSGEACSVDYYSFGKLGPKKEGQKLVDPNGVSIWISGSKLEKIDRHYGFERSSEWKPGICVWAQHKVWDPATKKCLEPGYFGSHKGSSVDELYFTNTFFKSYWARFFKAARKLLGPEVFIMCQPPTLAIPPTLKGTDLIDDHVIYAPHFYDGLTLMLKKWNNNWNLDCIGYLRGRYLLPVFAMKFGATNVRKCLAQQIGCIKQEGKENLGENIPVLMSETGIPMDMNDKDSYYKTGDYTSQTLALDATSFALEENTMHHTLWCYTSVNSHKCGDYWNGEDFSYWSAEPLLEKDGRCISTYDATVIDSDKASLASRDNTLVHSPYKNVRAVTALVRPFPLKVSGRLLSYGFDLSSQKFTVKIESSGSKDATQIFYPSLHYPDSSEVEVIVSYGKWELDSEHGVINWYHPADGEQTLEISAKEEEGTGKGCCTIM